MKTVTKSLLLGAMVSALFMLASCNRIHNYMVLKKFYDKQMDFSGEYWKVTSDTAITSDPSMALGPVNLISFLDEHLCTPCLSNYLNAALRYTYSFDSDSLKYICIAYPRELSDLRESINGLSSKEITIFYDVNNTFFEKNHLIYLKQNAPKSFLVDRNGKIILVGDPITSEPLYKLYKQSIRNLLDELKQ